MVRVEGKVAFVAGAGGGIGGASALGLGREGGAVVCADIDATQSRSTSNLPNTCIVAVIAESTGEPVKPPPFLTSIPENGSASSQST
jgi:NAD(P)-dependent dehydrogenase (short-subunit alcohol dehydrogenase family)